MTAYARGFARIRHADTGDIYIFQASQLEWAEGEPDDRQMGLERHHWAFIEHPDLGQLSWYVSEYPVGSESDRETNVGPHTIVSNFDFGLDDSDGSDTEFAVEDLVEWFAANYQDPALETPYNSREGGYLFVYGGPYDARDEIESNFPDAREDLINQAVAEIESSGIIEWAPIAREFEEDAEWEEQLHDAFRQAIDDVPTPRQGPRFRPNERGELAPYYLASEDDRTSSELGELLPHLEQAFLELENAIAGSNAHAILADSVSNYRRALDDTEISIDRLYTAGIRLENTQQATENEIERGNLPELPAASHAALKSVLSLHGTVIASTGRGRSLLKNAALYSQSEGGISQLKEAGRRLSEVVSQAQDLFSDETKALLADDTQAIGEGPHPERSTQKAVSTSNNLLSAIFRGSGYLTLSIVTQGILGSEVGSAAVAEVSQFSNLCSAFILQNLGEIKAFASVAGADFQWLRSICDMLSYARSRFSRPE